MRVVRGEDRRAPLTASVIVLGALAVLGFTVVGDHSVATVAPITAVIVTAAVAYNTLLSWRSLITLILLVILFIPIRVYDLPASLPFHLELYRLLVAFVAVGWVTCLLIDPRVRARRSGLGLEGPLAIYVMTILVSLIVNAHRVSTVSSEVYKKLAYFASFFIVLYIILSVARRARDLDFFVSVLVISGGILGVFAIFEARTGYNVFNHLSSAMPFLRFDPSQLPHTHGRGGRLRVYASAQHAIALGAVFAMLVPLAVYRIRTRKGWIWWLMPLAMVVGALSTGSRTAIVMFLVEGLAFLILRPRETKRLWPALIPAVLVVHVATPGSLGAIRGAFLPQGGLVAQQKHANVGSGRLATLWPALHHEFHDPLVGEGFGTRVVKPTPTVPVANGPILDDQWLGILLETGFIGALSLMWMFIRFVRRTGREARRDLSPRGWLLSGVTASVAAFAASMFFYDAFSFVQITFMLFIFMGFGAAVMRTRAEEWEALGAEAVGPARASTRLATT